MSAEAWRRFGSDLAPPDVAWQAWRFARLSLDLCGRRGTFATFIDVRGSLETNWVGFGAADVAWQAWHFARLSLDLCGRRGTFATFMDVRGSLATNWVGFGAARCCVAGVALCAPQPRFVWQAWYFRYLDRCPRKLGDDWGRIWRRPMLRGRRGTSRTSASICVAGVVLSLPSWIPAEAWRRIGSDLAPPDVAWQAWHFAPLSFDLCGRRGTFRYLHRRPRKLGDELGRIWRRPMLRGRRGTLRTSASICVAGVGLSLPSYTSVEAWRRIGSDLAPPDVAWQAWHFAHLSFDLCGRRGTFATFIDVRGSLATNWVGFGAARCCVAGVALCGPQP